jgi:hypothetical protein
MAFVANVALDGKYIKLLIAPVLGGVGVRSIAWATRVNRPGDGARSDKKS